uniref:Uncharacterized protein n=1 Tax=Solanum lycopersicum TaxID=4081 RepID=A0A3Q7FEE5_SOLLC
MVQVTMSDQNPNPKSIDLSLVIVRDVFYNLEVQRKQMHSKVLHSPKESLLRISLAHRSVSFKIVDIGRFGNRSFADERHRHIYETLGPELFKVDDIVLLVIGQTGMAGIGDWIHGMFIVQVLLDSIMIEMID